jgi:alpha-mannosidase
MTRNATAVVWAAGFLISGLACAAGRAGAAAPPPPWLKGWARTISGETLGYHSPYPDATTALLSRATDGSMAVQWETEPVPGDFSGPSATFIWMSGLATGKGAHRFTLSVDGEAWIDFRTGKDDSEREWKIPGPEGASLSFKTTFVDQFRELFGFMFLTVPRSRLAPGKPLRLKVVGEKAGSNDWFMVFPYTLAPSIKANGEPALVRADGRLSQPVRVEISHIAPPEDAHISAEGGGRRTVRLETGYNAVYFPVPAVSDPKNIEIAVEVGGKPAARKTVELRPVTRRTVWLLPHSHVDIGYSGLQAEVEKSHWRYFEQAIELARRSENAPPGARFKWNVEVLWAVDTYLRQASPARAQAFVDAVKKGWIGLQALPANILTGVCVPEELFRMMNTTRTLSERYGFSIDTAMITDIPSYTWSLVPALVQNGVSALSSGPNYMPNLSDGGDRIGYAMKAWADKPFYWLSPSGKEKLLFWMAGRGYSWFHGLNMGNFTVANRQPIFDYMRELENKGYPYEMVQVRYTTGGDNGPPDPKLSETVAAWNAQFESPRFVIATSAEMFREFERRYGDRIPAVRGDFTPYWEDGAVSTARETALNRASANRLLQAETLWAMRRAERFPAAEFAEAWRQVVLWDEHTWGAADSVSDPDGANARAQWAYKQAFALEADRRSRALFERALGSTRPSASENFIEVLNTNSWEVTDIVLVPARQSAAGDKVEDERGRPVPSQRLSTGELALLAERVPGFGSRRFAVLPGASLTSGRARASGAKLDNGSVFVALDPADGSIRSLKWMNAGNIDLVDTAEGRGLNAYLYVPGLNPELARGVESVRITVKETGPLVASLLVESDAPGSRSLGREIRVYSGLDKVDMADLIDKAAVREKESVHIAFPFRVPLGQVRLDLGWGIIRPDIDQIAGACKDFFGIHAAADISNGRFGLTWISRDAPLAEVGRMTDESRRAKGRRAWRTEVGPTQILYSYAMNNYWHTNYKADQEGPALLRYSIVPHGPFRPQDIEKRGLEACRPLIAASPCAGSSSSGPLISVGPDGVIATSLAPAADESAILVRLYNPSARDAEARLSVRGLVLPKPVRLAAWESRAVRLENALVLK